MSKMCAINVYHRISVSCVLYLKCNLYHYPILILHHWLSNSSPIFFSIQYMIAGILTNPAGAFGSYF